MIIRKAFYYTIISFLLSLISLLISLKINFEELILSLLIYFTVYLFFINLLIVIVLEKNEIVKNELLKKSTMFFLTVSYFISIYILNTLGSKNDIYIWLMLINCILLSVCLYNKCLYIFFENSIY